nr:hypothetical protein [uncultured Allomuricauda sp.]
MDGSREAPRRSKTLNADGGEVFKEVEALFMGKTGLGLDRFDKCPWAFLQTQGQVSVREVKRAKALVS